MLPLLVLSRKPKDLLLPSENQPGVHYVIVKPPGTEYGLGSDLPAGSTGRKISFLL